MKFLDECTLKIKAGKGGDGIISFRREYRVDKGGPDGGDGGDGGSIYFIGDSGVNTLYHLKFMKHIFGNDGGDGGRKNCSGANGEDVLVRVPLGTMVFKKDKLILDITDEKKYLIANGGKGGRGNQKFKTSKNMVPHLSENGIYGESFELKLSLKILADVGFVGKPSAGKSTILSKISSAKPKIADYHFTTLTPQLGIVYIDGNSFVAADLPGLIKGAHEGKGLGIEFLKHIERCKVIAHIIDFGDENKEPIDDFEVVNQELKSYSLALEKRIQVVVANKSDLPLFIKKVENFKIKYPYIDIVEISAIQQKNIENLKRFLFKAYEEAKKIVSSDTNVKENEITITLEENPILVKNPWKGMFDVEGVEVFKWYQKIPLSSTENFRRFNRKMKDIGVWLALEEKGIKNGDTVRIYSYEFTWDEDEF